MMSWTEGSELAWEFNTYLTMTRQRRRAGELHNNIARVYACCSNKKQQASMRKMIDHCRAIVENNRYNRATRPSMYCDVSLDLVWKVSADKVMRNARSITRDNWRAFAAKNLTMLFDTAYPDPVERFKQMLVRGAWCATPALFDCVLCAFVDAVNGQQPNAEAVTRGPVLRGSAELALHVIARHPGLIDRNVLAAAKRPLLLQAFKGFTLLRAQAANTLQRAWRGFRAAKPHVERLWRARRAAALLALAWRCCVARRKLGAAAAAWRAAPPGVSRTGA